MHAAILGLGEAGSRYAADLTAAGWQVSGYDPAPVDTPAGVLRAVSAAAAAAGSDLVIGLTGAAAAPAAAAAAAPGMRPGGCYADFNSASAAQKRQVEMALAGPGAMVEMADVAVLAPVCRTGAATPLLVSGPGAMAVAAAFGALGAPVDVLDAPGGAVAAARAAGCEPWLRDQIAAELGPGGHGLVDRLIDGSARHAARRIPEVEASRAYLRDLGVPTPVCDATLRWLGTLRDA